MYDLDQGGGRIRGVRENGSTALSPIFLQDPLDYTTRTLHSSSDTFDHLIPEDMKQAAVVVATFLYNTAMRDERLPR
jgi:hypothetical protein